MSKQLLILTIMKLKYLIISNSKHDEIIRIYKKDVPMKTIIKHLINYLKDTERYKEYINNTAPINEANEFNKIKYFLMEYHDTFTNVIETKLEK